MAARKALTSLDDIRRWLAGMPEAQRVRTARLLADSNTTREIAVIADDTIAGLFADATAAQVAEKLDITVAQVRRAVAQHKARQRGR